MRSKLSGIAAMQIPTKVSVPDSIVADNVRRCIREVELSLPWTALEDRFGAFAIAQRTAGRPQMDIPEIKRNFLCTMAGGSFRLTGNIRRVTCRVQPTFGH